LARYDYEKRSNRDKASFDIFSPRDESFEEPGNLPDPNILAQEIVALRLVSLRTTQSQGSRPGRELRRRAEDLEATLEKVRFNIHAPSR
jgi:hypothetical protein